MTNDYQKRIDKFLWSVRIYKTRTIAAEECRKGRILIDDIPVKASRNVKPGERIHIKKPPVTYSYLIRQIPMSRVSAKIAGDFIEDLTSPEELKKLELTDSFFVKRDRGTGRPTKKERRILDNLRTDL
jgi:ribosome-associated heat shock protein Hsp15